MHVCATVEVVLMEHAYFSRYFSALYYTTPTLHLDQ